MFITGIQTVWVIVIVTALLCYFAVPCLTNRNLRITSALGLFVAAMSVVVVVKPETAGVYGIRFASEMYWFASTVVVSCFVCRWKKAK